MITFHVFTHHSDLSCCHQDVWSLLAGVLHDQLLQRRGGLRGHQPQGPGQHHRAPVRAVQPLQTVDTCREYVEEYKNIWQNIENIQQVLWLGTEHGGEVVSLPLGLVLAEVAVLPQHPTLHHTRLHQPRQARDVAETEVHPLNNQSDEYCGRVTNQR